MRRKREKEEEWNRNVILDVSNTQREIGRKSVVWAPQRKRRVLFLASALAIV